MFFVQYPIELFLQEGNFLREGLTMKALHILIPITLALAAGCKSHDARTASSTSTVVSQEVQTRVASQEVPTATAHGTVTNGAPQQIITDKAIYTIEVIPNPHLSATSREGDKTNEVYSSNIVAVYVHPRDGATVNSTNLPAAPGAENNPSPESK
jgi:hypothetical protein